MSAASKVEEVGRAEWIRVLVIAVLDLRFRVMRRGAAQTPSERGIVSFASI